MHVGDRAARARCELLTTSIDEHLAERDHQLIHRTNHERCACMAIVAHDRNQLDLTP
jgi:hypothetical protein